MSFRSVSASEIVIGDPPRHAPPNSSDMEAMMGRIYDLNHFSVSRQLADSLRRVVGHRFHSRHIGGVGEGGACERLGAQVNVLQGRHLTNKCRQLINLWKCILLITLYF